MFDVSFIAEASTKDLGSVLLYAGKLKRSLRLQKGLARTTLSVRLLNPGTFQRIATLQFCKRRPREMAATAAADSFGNSSFAASVTLQKECCFYPKFPVSKFDFLGFRAHFPTLQVVFIDLTGTILSLLTFFIPSRVVPLCRCLKVIVFASDNVTLRGVGDETRGGV